MSLNNVLSKSDVVRYREGERDRWVKRQVGEHSCANHFSCVWIAHLAVEAVVGGSPAEPRWSWSDPAGSSGAEPSASTRRASAAGWGAGGSGWPQRKRPPGCRKWRRWRWWGRPTPQWPSSCSDRGSSAARPLARPRAPREPPSFWRDAPSDPSLSRPERTGMEDDFKA